MIDQLNTKKLSSDLHIIRAFFIVEMSLKYQKGFQCQQISCQFPIPK